MVAALVCAVAGASVLAPRLPPFRESPAAASSSPPGNLLTGDQASFTLSTGGWVGLEATLSWVPTVGDSLPGALGITPTAASGVGAASGTPTSGGLVAATPGWVYAAGAAVEAVTAAQPVQPLLVFYSSSGAELDTVFGAESQAVTGSWTETTPVSAVAPPGSASVALLVDLPSTAPGEELYLDDAWLQGVADQTAEVKGPLHTSSNQILDANGNTVHFRGVVLNGLEQDGTLSGSGVSEQAVEDAKAWGANFVRVPLGEQFWLSSNCDYVASYEATVDEVVNWITSLGMVAMLDLHYNTVGGCETGEQHEMADEAQSPTFWSAVAARYGNPTSPEYNPLVAFDLYNEPHDISDAVWLNGGTITDNFSPFQTYQAAGMQQLYNSVRAAGAQNLVFISGTNWANTVPSTLVSGDNIVYAAHAYTCPTSPPPASNCRSDPSDPSQILDAFLGVSSSWPVVVTEFGWPSQVDGTYIANVISFAESHGWGWSAFAWEDLAYPTEWDLALAYLPDGAAEPAPSGMPVLCALATAASGSSPCVAPAPTTPVTLPTTTVT
ncbi:MAG: glycoside hydrolase family 5 protein, partial [Acidimicrobiales bacterium]